MNLNDLRLVVRRYLITGDSVRDEDIYQFILMCENNMNDRLRTYRQRTTVTLDLTDETEGEVPSDDPDALSNAALLPTDFLAVDNVYGPGSPNRPLVLITENDARGLYAFGVSGMPVHYAITGITGLSGRGIINVYPPGAEEVVLAYYAAIPPLSDTNRTNWVLDRFPNAYIFGTLTQAALFKAAPEEKAQQWASSYEQAMSGIEMDDIRARFPRGGIRKSGPTP